MSVQAVNSVKGVAVDTTKLKGANPDKKIRFFFLELDLDKTSPKNIAQSLFDDISGLGTGKEFQQHLEKLNKDNVIEVLEQYKKISAANGDEENLIEAIYSETWLSRSTPKKYTQMIFDRLEEKSNELGIDNSVLKKKFQAELNSLSSQVKTNFGWADSTNLEFFADEMSKRIGFKTKLNAAHDIKARGCAGNTAPNSYEFERIKGIVGTHEVSVSDILGNGKLDNVIKQVNPNCWALAGLNTLTRNDELKEAVNNLIYKKDGITSVYIPEADKVYSFTEKEILDGTKKAYCIGDGDAVAVLMATDKYFKSLGDEDYKDSRGGSLTIGRMLEVMTGLSDANPFSKVDDIQPQSIVSTEKIFSKGVAKFIQKLQNGEPYAGIFCFVDGVKAEKVSINETDKEPEALRLSGFHAYTIYSADENYVYLNDTNYPDSYIRIPHKSLRYTLDAAIYRYR